MGELWSGDRQWQSARIHHDLSDAGACGINNWGSAFLPGGYQGTPLGNASVPSDQAHVRYINNPNLPRDVQRLQLERLKAMNREHLAGSGPEPSLEARINSFELAFRMQSTMPIAEDLSDESVATQHLYGLDDPSMRISDGCA